MTMARHTLTITDSAGNVVAGAHVEVRREVPGLPLAVLYSDRAGTAVLGNPFDVDAGGVGFFHAAGGAYQIRAYVGPSLAPTFEVIQRYVAIGLNAEGDGTGTLTQRTFQDAGNLVIVPDDADQLNVKKTAGAPTRVILPLSAASPAKPKRVVDAKYDAATNNITLVPSRPSTVTISSASPGVVTLAAHGRAANDPVSFETTGALWTGLAPDTQYYVKAVLTANTFTVSATPGGAAINTSGSQSGVHTMGTDTIMGGAAYTIDSNGAGISLMPLIDGTGWI